MTPNIDWSLFWHIFAILITISLNFRYFFRKKKYQSPIYVSRNDLKDLFLKQSAACFRAWGLLYQGFDFHGGGARKRFTSVLQHQIFNFHIKYGMSHIETTHVPSLHLTMSATIQYIQKKLK